MRRGQVHSAVCHFFGGSFLGQIDKACQHHLAHSGAADKQNIPTQTIHSSLLSRRFSIQCFLIFTMYFLKKSTGNDFLSDRCKMSGGVGRYKVLWESNIAIVTKIVESRISETAGNQVLGGRRNTFGNFSTLEGNKSSDLI